MSRDAYATALNSVNGLKQFVQQYQPDLNEEETLTMMDTVIEGLHQHSMLGKEDKQTARTYSDMLGSMLGSVGDLDDFSDLDQ